MVDFLRQLETHSAEDPTKFYLFLANVVLGCLFLSSVVVPWALRKTARAVPRPMTESQTKIPFAMYQAGEPSNGHVRFAHEPASDEVMQERVANLYKTLNMRRSVRFYSGRPIPEGVLETAIACAGTSPSGAHQQPWTFVVVRNPSVRQQIREAVEREERLNYERRMRASWVKDIESIVNNLHSTDGSSVVKPYITDAPALVIVMKQEYGVASDGSRIQHYYAHHGVGLATGMFIAALQYAGLATLTSTPMGAERAIRDACNRPENEKVFLLMPVGFASSDATVPYRTKEELRKPYNEIAVHVD